MLPQYIHMHVAESVLFAGKAIRVLRNPNTASRFHGPAASSPHRFPVKIHGFTEQYLFSKEMLVESDVIREELLPQSEADKIESMLRDLKVSIAGMLDFLGILYTLCVIVNEAHLLDGFQESSEFHKRLFECAVDSIRAIAASHLWQVDTLLSMI